MKNKAILGYLPWTTLALASLLALVFNYQSRHDLFLYERSPEESRQKELERNLRLSEFLDRYSQQSSAVAEAMDAKEASAWVKPFTQAVTANFIHLTREHYWGNLQMLFLVAIPLELGLAFVISKRLAHIAIPAVFLLSGFSASLVRSFCYNSAGAGASAGLAGLLASALVAAALVLYWRRRRLPRFVIAAGALVILSGMLVPFLESNTAHIYGYLAGFLFSLPFALRAKPSPLMAALM